MRKSIEKSSKKYYEGTYGKGNSNSVLMIKSQYGSVTLKNNNQQYKSIKIMKKLIITSIIFTMSLSVNAQSWWNSKKVRGNGNVTTETRSTSDYEGVSFGGSFDVVLVKGKEGKITIKGEENLLKYIETEVKRGVLKIKVKKGVNLRMTRKMVVTVPYQDH